jgi:hypothetical protein
MSVYVIMLVPAETPVTNPVVEFTVATAGVADVQATAAGVPDPLSKVVEPTQTDNVPVMVGSILTVTVAVLMQPKLFVYVIVLEPEARPETSPVELIVATVVFEDTHGSIAAAAPDPVN